MKETTNTIVDKANTSSGLSFANKGLANSNAELETPLPEKESVVLYAHNKFKTFE